MDFAARHVDVLSHRWPGMPELISPDARRKAPDVKQGGDALAEAVCGDLRNAEQFADLRRYSPILFGSRQVPAVDRNMIAGARPSTASCAGSPASRWRIAAARWCGDPLRLGAVIAHQPLAVMRTTLPQTVSVPAFSSYSWRT